MVTLKQIQKYLTDNDVHCPHCNSKWLNITSYPHPDGIEIDSKPGKQWVYNHCLHCSLDTKLAVLLQLAKINQELKKEEKLVLS